MVLRLFLFSLLGFLPVTGDASTDFRPLLEEAARRGDREVVIPPGTYRLKPTEGSAHVFVRDARDLVIHAEGVVLICEDLTRAITFSNCRNVTLKGLTVDYDPLPFTQGEVIGGAADDSWVDVRLHAGYPRKPYARIDVVDSSTRFRKRGMPFLWGTKADMVDDGVVRVHLKDIGKTARPGDLASLSTGPRPGGQAHAVAVESCEGMVFEDVSVLAAPGFGIIEQDGGGGMRYNRCRVVPGPKPAGATEDRLLSSTWDAMQSKTMKRGPLVENCEIRDAGDDSWSIQSSDYLVVAANGSRAILAFRDEHCSGPEAGDQLTISLDAKPVTLAASRPIALPGDARKKIDEAKPWSLWKTSAKAVEVMVEGVFPFEIGDSVYCPDRQGAGYVFRNNRIRSSGRILLKAGDGIIENNTVIDGHAGVTVAPEVPDDAASGIRNVVIRNNSFVGTGYFCASPWSTQAGCISVASGGKGKIFENIVIEDNRFDDINGSAIVLFSTDGAVLKNNSFCRVMTTPPNTTGESFGVVGDALIWLKNSVNIRAENNVVYEAGSHLKLMAAAGNPMDSDLAASVAKSVTLSDRPCPWKTPDAH